MNACRGRNWRLHNKPMKTFIFIAALSLTTLSYGQPSFCGTFRGKLSDGSELVVAASFGTTGSMFVLRYARRSVDVANFAVSSTGSFVGTSIGGVTVTGKFTPDVASGSYGGLTFSVPRQPYYGPTQALSNGYFGSLIDPNTSSIQSLIMAATNQGELFIAVTRPDMFDAGIGTLDASGNFVVQTVAGTRYSGQLTVTNNVGAGNIVINGRAGATFTAAQSRGSVLQNISTRGFVGAGDNVLIAGFIVADGSKPVLIRAMGPTLKLFGVSSPLPDPTLEVHDATGRIIAANDDWASAPATMRLPIASGLTGIDAKDAGLILTLDPGSYSVVLRGANNSTGVAIVEVFEVR